MFAPPHSFPFHLPSVVHLSEESYYKLLSKMIVVSRMGILIREVEINFLSVNSSYIALKVH